MRYFYVVLMVLFFFSCREEEKGSKDLLVVHVDASDLQTVDWEQVVDVSSVEIIPLETTSESIFGRVERLFVHDSMYCLSTGGAVLMFDLAGHFLKKLSKKGKGPGEYIWMVDLWMDEKQDLHLLDYNGQKILVYNKADRLKKSIPTELYAMAFARLTEDIWAIYTGSNVQEVSNCRLNLFSLSQQKIIQKFHPVTDSEKEWRHVMGLNNFVSYDSSLFFFYAFNDTVYRLTTERLEPAVVIDYGKDRLPPSIVESKHRDIAEFSELVNRSKWVYSTNPIYFTNEGMLFAFWHKAQYRHVFYNYKAGRSMVVDTYRNYLGLKNYSTPSNVSLFPMAYKDGYFYDLIAPVQIKEEFREAFVKKYGLTEFDEEANAYLVKYKLKGNMKVE